MRTSLRSAQAEWRGGGRRERRADAAGAQGWRGRGEPRGDGDACSPGRRVGKRSGSAARDRQPAWACIMAVEVVRAADRDDTLCAGDDLVMIRAVLHAKAIGSSLHTSGDAKDQRRGTHKAIENRRLTKAGDAQDPVLDPGQRVLGSFTATTVFSSNLVRYCNRKSIAEKKSWPCVSDNRVPFEMGECFLSLFSHSTGQSPQKTGW